MSSTIEAFKVLPLAEMGAAHKQITEAYQEAKLARLSQLEAEISALGFRSGGKGKPVENV